MGSDLKSCIEMACGCPGDGLMSEDRGRLSHQPFSWHPGQSAVASRSWLGGGSGLATRVFSARLSGDEKAKRE